MKAQPLAYIFVLPTNNSFTNDAVTKLSEHIGSPNKDSIKNLKKAHYHVLESFKEMVENYYQNNTHKNLPERIAIGYGDYSCGLHYIDENSPFKNVENDDESIVTILENEDTVNFDDTVWLTCLCVATDPAVEYESQNEVKAMIRTLKDYSDIRQPISLATINFGAI